MNRDIHFSFMSTLIQQNGMQVIKGFFKTKLSLKIYLEVDLITSFIAERPFFLRLEFFLIEGICGLSQEKPS